MAYERKCPKCGNVTQYNDVDGKYWYERAVKENRCCKKCTRMKKPYEWIYNLFLTTAKRRNRTVELTYEEFLEFVCISRCHYCEGDIKWSPYASDKRTGIKSYKGYNLDRKNNLISYTKDNCIVCCYECNELKGSRLSYEEMLILKPALIQIRQLRKVG